MTYVEAYNIRRTKYDASMAELCMAIQQYPGGVTPRTLDVWGWQRAYDKPDQSRVAKAVEIRDYLEAAIRTWQPGDADSFGEAVRRFVEATIHEFDREMAAYKVRFANPAGVEIR